MTILCRSKAIYLVTAYYPGLEDGWVRENREGMRSGTFPSKDAAEERAVKSSTTRTIAVLIEQGRRIPVQCGDVILTHTSTGRRLVMTTEDYLAKFEPF